MNPKASSDNNSIRLILLTLIAVLSCYYLWVLYKAATPNVSIAYKTYYIKQQNLYWDIDNPDLSLSIPKRLKVEQNLPFLSRQGWSKDVIDHARQLESQGGLYFTVNQAIEQPIELTIDLTTPVTQSIDITVNQWHGTLQPSISQPNHLTTIIPTTAFLAPKAVQQLTVLNSKPLSVQQITLESEHE
ncbi:TPA: riboflavin synthase subunit alpha [Photobacterium damselae]|uniref:riboflavin synthase subunit alpha n=1 Tax=Photobacterium damselae TaxID=38293 RepID=UPI001EFE76D4|nr:riboflavin synthase subunit alpha [Photobacterium damselae]MCG9705393.1 riboflavin synthase subunit alpha [Photobacterium damselae]